MIEIPGINEEIIIIFFDNEVTIVNKRNSKVVSVPRFCKEIVKVFNP